MALYPVILAGGSGTRLWPLSREYYPKPFLAITGERTMLQEAICRLDGIEDVSDPIIVCNEEHRFLVAEQARQLAKAPPLIILEPVGRNTAPALTLAALTLADARQGPQSGDPVMLVMPADHVIQDVEAFQSAVRLGVGPAESGCLVTFGIEPTSARTGYGYIKKGKPARGGHNPAPFHVDAFVEKPDKATADSMLESGGYLWNSGIFMMKVSVWLRQLEHHRPDIVKACRSAHAQGHRDGDFYRPGGEAFTACPSDTIDYAVMEKVAGGPEPDGTGPASPAAVEGASPSGPICVVVPLDAGWSDIGTWSAFWEQCDHDAQGNVIQGDVYAHSMRDSLLIGQHHVLAAVGLDNVIIVETPDAVLVAHKDHVQDVKALVQRLKRENRPEQENHRKVHRPWGSYEVMDAGPRFQVKRLTVNPGASLSLQKHHHRAEHWVVVKGVATVTKGDEKFMLTENESAYVPVGMTHRLENQGTIPLEIIEVQSGSHLAEDDIVRLEDRYNRHREEGPTA